MLSEFLLVVEKINSKSRSVEIFTISWPTKFGLQNSFVLFIYLFINKQPMMAGQTWRDHWQRKD